VADVRAMTAENVVREFWRLMASNDFDAVAVVLDTEFVLDWPQSNERIRGAARFAQMNREYPAHGRWSFDVQRVVDDGEAASVVAITDGVQRATALSFFSIAEGRITRLVEYWPDPYPAVGSRAHLVEPISP